MKIRTIIATTLAGAALAAGAAACGDDETTDDPGGQSDAPVNTETPSADPGSATNLEPVPTSEGGG